MALHYIEAGKLLDTLLSSDSNSKPKSFKKLLYGSGPPKSNVSVVFALASESLKYISVLNEIITNARLNNLPHIKAKGHLIHVMVYDLLLGQKKSISGGGTVKKAILSNLRQIQSEFTKLKVKYKVSDASELIPQHLKVTVVLPRWVRVNLLNAASVQTVKDSFKNDGWTEVTYDEFFANLQSSGNAKNTQNSDSNSSVSSSKVKMNKCFCSDRDLPDLLAFPPHTDFHSHPLYQHGHIVLQDKASALSGAALVFEATSDTVALDACAAPGQKTSQIAQTMKNQGKLFAFDLDSTRLSTLRKLCKRNGLKNLTAVNSSFLTIDVDSEPYSDVEHILLDPSCSGSGIVNRLDYLMSSTMGVSESLEVSDGGRLGSAQQQEAARSERALKLQEFQLSMLSKAFSFPHVQQIVYSTCSIYDEENEQVVEKALELSNGQFKVAKVLPHVPMRGKSSYPHGELCVRTDPERDHTIGFFVSLFVRTSKVSKKKRKTPTPDTTIIVPASEVTPSNESIKQSENINHPEEEAVSMPVKKKAKTKETYSNQLHSTTQIHEGSSSTKEGQKTLQKANTKKNPKKPQKSRPLFYK